MSFMGDSFSRNNEALKTHKKLQPSSFLLDLPAAERNASPLPLRVNFWEGS
jgi:hypothetical protein